jgi:hypothetical protein
MSPKGTLSVMTPSEITEVRILDDTLREVASGTHELKVELEPGIYQVQARIPGDVTQKLVAVEAGSTVSVNDLKLRYDSSTPLGQAESSHEYHEGPAYALSRQTHKSVGTDPKARLFLFARTKGKEDKRDQKPSFTLRDNKAKPIVKFPEVGDINLDDGWLALSLNMPAGIYSIEQEVPGQGKRGQALFVEDNWQTQVFAPWHESSDFGLAAIYMRPKWEGFEPNYFWEYQRTEAALQGLAHGKLVLSPNWVEDFLYGKFNNPMLGLIGTYALLDQETIDYERLRIIAQNLLQLLPHSPDAKLISLLAELKDQWPPPVPKNGWPEFEDPPLFAAGTDRLIRLASVIKELCPADSWLARISPLMTAGSAWTRWESGITTPKAVTRLQTELRTVVDRHVDILAEGINFPLIPKSIVKNLLRAVFQGGSAPIIKTFKQYRIKLPAFIDQSSKDMAKELAPRAGLPLSVVEEVMKQLMEGSSLQNALLPAEASREAKKAKARSAARRRLKRLSDGQRAPKKSKAAKPVARKSGSAKRSAAKGGVAKKASAKKKGASVAARGKKTAAKKPVKANRGRSRKAHRTIKKSSLKRAGVRKR